MNTATQPNLAPSGVNTPQRILESVITNLSEGKISEVVGQFDDHFTFTDHALALEFTEKEQLTEFFRKSHELFPDTVVEAISIYASGDSAIAEWKLTASQIEYLWGENTRKMPIFIRGISVVHTKNGRIAQWSDYYGQITSRRVGLAAAFREWIEY